MIWIVLAILVSGYMISVAIKKSAAIKASTDLKIEQSRKSTVENNRQTALENTPLYQKLLNASIEYMDYLEESTDISERIMKAKLQLSGNSKGTDDMKLRETIKTEEIRRNELQNKWFSKWDKYERQIDPRHNFLDRHEKIAKRWKTYERRHNELNSQLSSSNS